MGYFANKALSYISSSDITISSSDDDYNSIEGMGHSGIAQYKRKQTTEFGSGWDKLRALTKSLGHDYDSFIQSSHFQEKLSSGRVVKSLGGGAFGEAHLMQTEIGTGKKKWIFFGKEKTVPFQYVRKTYDNKSNVQDIKHEVRGLMELQDTNVPSFYGLGSNKNKKAIYMEAMEGKMVDKEYLKGQIPESAIKDLRGFLTTMHDRGMAHMDLGQNARFFKHVDASVADRVPYVDDIVPRNMMVTPEGRMAVLDMGLWQRTSLAAEEGFENVSFVKNHQVGVFAQISMGVKVKNAQEVDLAVISSLERHKGKLSTAGQELMDKVYYSESQIKNGVSAVNATAVTDPGAKKVKKHNMSQANRQTVATAMTNAHNGGKRSKSKFSNSMVFAPTQLKG